MTALVPPEPPLSDGTITLRPLAPGDEPLLQTLVDDPITRRFTLIPLDPEPGFTATWLDRYVQGWADGTRGGFAACWTDGGDFAGFGSLLHYQPETEQVELGYVVAPDARGKGVATRILTLLSGWCLDTLGLQRVELEIAAGNAASLSVARRVGFVYEGTRRNAYIKPGSRGDLTIWSKIAAA